MSIRLVLVFFIANILIPLWSSGQEPRVRVAPVRERPSDYWVELKDVPLPVAEARPVAKARPVEQPRTVERRSTPVQTPAWQTRYTLGPGDTLNFSVYDRADLARENVSIAPDGTISYLQAVAVRAQGLTLDQLRSRIEDELSKYQKSIKVIITPAEVVSKQFSIIGRVRKPGSFVLDRPTTVLEGISLAEGIQVGTVRSSAFELADFERSFVARRGKKLDVDLARLYYEGDFSQNAYLEPDDYIYVASNLENEIYVLGAVKESGRRKMPVKLTLARAIAEAGGFTDAAYRKRVLLVRGSIHQPTTRIVDVKDILEGRAQDIPLQNRDIIFVSRHPLDVVERALDSAIITFMQTVTAETMNQSYNPILGGGRYRD